jgi:transglutaminase-like putative cysteine protease
MTERSVVSTEPPFIYVKLRSPPRRVKRVPRWFPYHYARCVLRDDLAPYLEPTFFIDSDHPLVRERSAALCEGARNDRERARRLYYAVRDGIRYDPYSITADPQDYRASNVVSRTAAYCIPKAVLLVALARALGIPARLGFADVRNHLTSEKLRAVLGSDLFVFHGYAELWLDARWVKATPVFNIELCERFGVRPLDFDGVHDSLFQEYSADGKRHMEYVAQRGSFADLPLDAILDCFEQHYGRRDVMDGHRREVDRVFDGTEDPSGS